MTAKNRNGSCTSPTSALVNSRSSRAPRDEPPPGIGTRSDYSGSSTSLSGTGAPASAGAAATAASVASTSGAPARTRPDCVRRSKSQGTSSHHRYRDRLVRTLAFNSSCPVSTREEEPGPWGSAAGGPAGDPAPEHSSPGHHGNGGRAQHDGRDESPQPAPVAARRNLLLLHHRHQSAYTSFGINVTWHTQTHTHAKNYSNKLLEARFFHYQTNNHRTVSSL